MNRTGDDAADLLVRARSVLLDALDAPAGPVDYEYTTDKYGLLVGGAPEEPGEAWYDRS